MTDPDAETLFAAFLAETDRAYVAYCGEPFATQADADAAWDLKCLRTDALCRLRARVEAMGYDGVADWHRGR